jgi:EAL domain-containing protein (putative c-di-GMP-specific phosphodiesterase class I)
MSAAALVPAPDRELKADRDRFVAFAFAFADLLLEVGADGRIRFAAGAARALAGREAPELIGTSFVDLFGPGDRRTVERVVLACRGGERVGAVSLRLARSGVPASISACGLPGREDTVHVAVAHGRAHAVDGAAAPRRDAVSGLLEAEDFSSAAADALENARALRQDVRLTLVRLCGVEALRARAGEGAVDHLFAEIGAFLNAHAMHGAAGRMGPDRCGVVHSAARPLDVAAETAGVLRAGGYPADLVTVDRSTVDLAAEGLAPADAAKALAFTLRRFAESEHFEPHSLAEAFRELVDDTVQRVTRLRALVDDERFEVAFQPIVRLADGRVAHYELLARVEARSPAEIIRFAEGIGMIDDLDLSICGRAVAHLQSPAARGGAPIAVNLSGGSLQSAAFTKSLLVLLERSRVPAAKLLFEITESAQIVDLEPVRRFVAELRRLGHGVCLDDFGAGAASFTYLQALPVDYVKIDGAYVGRLCENPRDRAIIKGMTAMCRDLGIHTIAEMIEREGQLDALLDLGVDLGQGFLFGQPQRRPLALPRPRAA